MASFQRFVFFVLIAMEELAKNTHRNIQPFITIFHVAHRREVFTLFPVCELETAVIKSHPRCLLQIRIPGPHLWHNETESLWLGARTHIFSGFSGVLKCWCTLWIKNYSFRACMVRICFGSSQIFRNRFLRSRCGPVGLAVQQMQNQIFWVPDKRR